MSLAKAIKILLNPHCKKNKMPNLTSQEIYVDKLSSKNRCDASYERRHSFHDVDGISNTPFQYRDLLRRGVLHIGGGSSAQPPRGRGWGCYRGPVFTSRVC